MNNIPISENGIGYFGGKKSLVFYFYNFTAQASRLQATSKQISTSVTEHWFPEAI